MRLMVLSLLLGCMEDQTTRYEKIAKQSPWNWRGEEASLLYSVTQHLGDYQVDISCPKRRPGTAEIRDITMRILDTNGKEIFALKAHRGTVFARDSDVLYVAMFAPNGTGCSVEAYDFRRNKRLWTSQLASCNPRGFSAYSNAVTIDELNQEALVVCGNESGYSYKEYLDMKTGKTLARRVY